MRLQIRYYVDFCILHVLILDKHLEKLRVIYNGTITQVYRH